MKKIIITLILLIYFTATANAEVCSAWTQCMWGRVISCEVRGPGCSWYVLPGQYVECRGYNPWGQWLVAWERCW